MRMNKMSRSATVTMSGRTDRPLCQLLLLLLLMPRSFEAGDCGAVLRRAASGNNSVDCCFMHHAELRRILSAAASQSS